MTTILHIAAQGEPEEFHAHVAAGTPFAVSLAVEIDAGTEEEGRAETERFLGTLGTGSFHLYEVDTNAGSATHLGEGVRIVGLLDPSPDLAQWLKDSRDGFRELANLEREKEDPIDPRFYVNEGSNSANMRNATAFDLLRSAAKWPAPLAQNAGLMSVVDVPLVDPAPNPQVLAFLPAGADPAAVILAGATSDADVFELTIPWLDSDNMITLTATARTVRLSKFDMGELGSRFRSDGRFVTPKQADILRRFLKRIEEQGATLLSPAAYLSSLTHDEEFLQGIDVSAEGADEPLYPAAMLQWIAKAAAVSAFDVTITGLMLPHSNTMETGGPVITRHSLVLQRLARIVASVFEEADHELDVDEDRLYLNLHTGLLGKFASLNAEGLWETMARPDDTGEWLPMIKKALTDVAPPANNHSPDEWKSEARSLSEELATLALMLESEESAESWLLNLFGSVFGDGSQIDIEGTGIPVIANPEDKANNPLVAAYALFSADIRSEFNAAEALRRDFGAELVAMMLSAASGNVFQQIEQIEAQLKDCNYLNRRFSQRSGEARILDDLIESVIAARKPASVPLADALARIQERRIEELLAGTPATSQFRPDAFPQPLPISIADSYDPSQMAAVADRISGLGFLVCARKSGEGEQPYVHANLVGIKSPEGQGAVVVYSERTVEPTLPTPVGGTTGLFLPYTGAPFSSPNLIEPGRGGQPAESRLAVAARKKILIHEKVEATYDNHSRLPSLAYGWSYGVSAFWVPLSGALPPLLRTDVPAPFDPVNHLFHASAGPFAIPDDAFTPYLRATAISESEMREISGGLRPGAGEKNLHPLALDDPRIVIEGVENGMRWHDLFRLGDGTGALGGHENVGDNKEEVISLANVQRGRNFQKDKLEVRMVASPSQDGVLLDQEKIAIDSKKDTLNLTVPRDGEPYWLRLSFAEDAGDQTISFSEPGHERGQDSAARTAPVILLAPASKDDATRWSVSSDMSMIVSLPRVSFEDFECWARNSKLWQATCGKDEAEADTLFELLRQARVVFEARGHPMAEQMKRLPDPAISGMLIGASLSDGVSKPGNIRTDSHFASVRPYAVSSMSIAGLTNEDKIVERLESLVERIFDAATLRVDVTSKGDVLSVSGTRVTIPSGQIAGFWACPAVRDAHFGQVIDPNLTQFTVGARRHDGQDYRLFDGVKAFLEVMHPLADKLEENVLRVRAEGTARSYSLENRPLPELRKFSQAVLITQRWQPSGRPIYKWIGPGANMTGDGPVVAVASAATANTPTTDIDPRSFEDDAFFGRHEDDAERQVIRLLPAPEITELFRFAWPERSATYLRHRVVLTSRYGDAIEKGVKSLRTPSWDCRVAILADPLAGAVTRPQLRAYLPLLRAVHPESSSPSAPLLCVLAEPPYAQLGLADRLDAELHTVNVYDFGENGESPTLQLRQLRKEVGPDPRLSYFPVDHETSLACRLNVEGPVGLHFDRPQASAPAWSNCQFLLHPTMADSDKGANRDELEESFFAIALSRHADPEWCWVPPSSRLNDTLPPDSDAWIIPTGPVQLLIGDQKIVDIKAAGGRLDVRILKDAMFSKGKSESQKPQEDNPEPDKKQDEDAGLLQLWEGEAGGVLLKSLTDGRYRVCVYDRANGVDDTDIITAGRIGRPSMVTSAVISAGTGLSISGSFELKATRQSETTFVEWARSARDLSSLAWQSGDSGGGDVRKVPFAGLSPLCTGGLIEFRASDKSRQQILSPVASRRYPLHLHRRLVQILRRPSEQTGHQITLFEDAAIADGWGSAKMEKSLPYSELTIAELELRAEIVKVANQAQEIPDHRRYASAFFDLAGSRSGNQATRQVRFHVRAANTRLDLADLQIAISAVQKLRPDGDDETIALDLIQPPEHHTTPVWSFELILFEQDGQLRYRLCWNEADGGRKEKTGDLDPGELGDAARLFESEALRLQLIDLGTSETWADISALHSASPFDLKRPDAFDFAWLFGAAEKEKLPEALSPDRLNRLPEAQARIVGISDPIPIVVN